MKKVISLVLAVALVASCFCLEAFAKTRSTRVTYNGRKIKESLSVSAKKMTSRMEILNPVIDGSVLIKTVGTYKVTLANGNTVQRSFGTPKGLEAEVWVESNVELSASETMKEATANYYANSSRVGRFEQVKP